MVQLAVQVACGGGHAPGGPFEGTGPFWTRDGHTGHRGRKKREATTPLPVVEKNEKDFLAHIGLGGDEAEGQRKKEEEEEVRRFQDEELGQSRTFPMPIDPTVSFSSGCTSVLFIMMCNFVYLQ